MHDDRAVVEKRLDRILAERLRPAVHTRTHPLDIAAWLEQHRPEIRV